MIPVARPPRWQVRAAGIVAVVVFLGLVARLWHPVYGFTALFQLDASNDGVKIAAFRELPVYVHRDTGGYDGLYYAQIAQDPTLRDPALPPAMDNFAYRARRILPPALAWLLGAGQPAAIIHTYALLNVAAWLALAAVLWRLLEVRDARGWLAWAGVLFSAGALGSVRLALTDLVALGILAGALLAAECGRGRLAAAGLAAAGLARETALLAVAGLCQSPWFSKKNVARGLVVAVPLGAWLAYVRWRAGPADQGWSNFTWPGTGLLEKWHAVIEALSTVEDRPLAWTTLLATLGLTVQAAFFVVRRDPADRWWRIGAAYTGLMLCLGTAVWEGFPGAATRVLLPLSLAFNVQAHRSRASFAWLLLGNLSVFAGLLTLRDVPSNPREVAALRQSGLAVMATAGEGWYGREAHGRHAWLWASGQQATVAIETWPKTDAKLRLTFALRSLAPRTITILQHGREIGRAEITTTLSRHTVELQVAAGRATAEFSTPAEPVPESQAPGSRRLAFALYDPELALAKP